MSAYRQDERGDWVPDQGMPFVDQIDFEVYHSPQSLRWVAYRGARELGRGTARTRWGLRWAVRRAVRRYKKQEGLA